MNVTQTVNELIDANKAEDLGETTDEQGNRWRKVRLPSGAEISEKVFNKDEADKIAEQERKDREAKDAKDAQNALDRAVIEKSTLDVEVKEFLIRRFNL